MAASRTNCTELHRYNKLGSRPLFLSKTSFGKIKTPPAFIPAWHTLRSIATLGGKTPGVNRIKKKNKKQNREQLDAHSLKILKGFILKILNIYILTSFRCRSYLGNFKL